MRNLKKILALVLALIMSLSLMATASATTFSDDDSINDTYRQAVEVLNGLEVLKGDDNGFRPEGNITRAEVAAILYRTTTGDVTDERANNYTPYGQFSDVNVGSWYAGYVTYSANAGYIKGYGNGEFKPNNQVTGYEVLTMILRAVGYDKQPNEFTGPDWQLHVASRAQEKGILDNIKGVALGEPATRQVVAEMIFRAILLNKVDYSTATLSYTPNSSRVADALGLQEVIGVVTANEYADLEGEVPMAAGKTRIVDADGKSQVLNVSSDLEAIGELHSAYVKDGSLVGSDLVKGGSTVAENGGAAAKVSDLAKSQGMKIGDSTEYFVNFGESADGYTSESRIQYVVYLSDTTLYDAYQLVYENGGQVKYATDNSGELDAGNAGNNVFPGTTNLKVVNEDAVKDARWSVEPISDYKKDTYKYAFVEYSKVITVGEALSSMDMQYIRSIFYGSDDSANTYDIADYAGEIYIGTQSGKDWSDTPGNTYKVFLEDFIGSDHQFDTCDNGEWLKIVDNDGDGVADYVMRTDFVMTTVTADNKQAGTYSVEFVDVDGSSTIPKDAIAYVDEDVDELLIGQVILYTLIDGVYWVQEPDSEVLVMDKINDKTATFTTADGTVYEWSGINRKAASYFDDLAEANVKTNYRVYKDAFDYIRLYKTDTQFVLLTDAYFKTDYRNDTFKADIYDDAEGKIVEREVVDTHFTDRETRDQYEFINTTEENNTTYHSNRDTWDRLVGFGAYRYMNHYYTDNDRGTTGKVVDPFLSNVAAASVDADGVYYLYDIEEDNTIRGAYHSYELVEDGVYSTMTGIINHSGGNNSQQVIKTTKATVYYYVEIAANGSITVKTGLDNMPSKGALGYAITSEVTTDSSVGYELAEIVVFEKSAAAVGEEHRDVLVLAPAGENTPLTSPTVTSSRARAASTDTVRVRALGYNETTGEYGLCVVAVDADDFAAKGVMQWYCKNLDTGVYHYEDETNANLYNKEGHLFFAGEVSTFEALNDERMQFSAGTQFDNKTEWYAFNTDDVDPADVPVVTLTQSNSTVYGTMTNADDAGFKQGEKVIYLVDSISDGFKNAKPVLAINLTQTLKNGNLTKEYTDILNKLWDNCTDELNEQIIDPTRGENISGMYKVETALTEDSIKVALEAVVVDRDGKAISGGYASKGNNFVKLTATGADLSDATVEVVSGAEGIVKLSGDNDIWILSGVSANVTISVKVAKNAIDGSLLPSGITTDDVAAIIPITDETGKDTEVNQDVIILTQDKDEEGNDIEGQYTGIVKVTVPEESIKTEADAKALAENVIAGMNLDGMAGEGKEFKASDEIKYYDGSGNEVTNVSEAVYMTVSMTAGEINAAARAAGIEITVIIVKIYLIKVADDVDMYSVKYDAGIKNVEDENGLSIANGSNVPDGTEVSFELVDGYTLDNADKYDENGGTYTAAVDGKNLEISTTQVFTVSVTGLDSGKGTATLTGTGVIEDTTYTVKTGSEVTLTISQPSSGGKTYRYTAKAAVNGENTIIELTEGSNGKWTGKYTVTGAATITITAQQTGLMPEPDEDGVITLIEDVTLTETYKVENADVTIDLAGYTITGSNVIPFQVKGKDLTITDSVGGGEVTVTESANFAIVMYNKGKLTVDEGVTIDASNTIYAIGVYGESGSATSSESEIEFHGTIDGVRGIYVTGVIKDDTRPTVVVDGATITTAGDCMYLAGNCDVSVTNSTLTSTESNGIEIRSGDLNVSGCSITAKETLTGWKPEGAGGVTTAGGSPIAVAQHSTNLKIRVNVEDCELVAGGYHVFAIETYPSRASNAGTVTVTIKGENMSIGNGIPKGFVYYNNSPVAQNVFKSNSSNDVEDLRPANTNETVDG